MVHPRVQTESGVTWCILHEAALWYKGHEVAQVVEALRYKPEGRGFDSQWCHWNFLLT
jgi:hypothetical protein